MINQVIKRVDRMLARLRFPFRALLGPLNHDSAVSLWQIIGFSGGPIDNVEFFQQWGFASIPPVGTPVIALPLGGSTAQVVVIASDGHNRIKGLQSGDIAVGTASGSSIVLHADGSILINAVGQLTYNGPQINVPNGDIIVQGKSFLTHKHNGVQAGNAQTGAPV